MLAILAITSPIFAIILLGFLLTRWGLFSKADMRVFGKFVINLALPALLFKALSQRQFSEIFNLGYLLAYASGSLLVIAIGYVWSRRITGLSPTTSTFYTMGMACSNSGFVGYPILLLVLAPIAGVALALNMMVENLLVIPLLLLMAERARTTSSQWQILAQSFKRLASNPMIIGLVAGLVVSISGWPLPTPLSLTVNMLASASGALSLFVIGGALVGLPVAGLGQRVLPIVLGKLLLHPLMILLALAALPLLGIAEPAPQLKVAALLLAAMPMMGIYPTLAQSYGQEDFSAAALLVTTIASFFSLSGLLWALQSLSLLG
jgi:predicted permease